MTKEEKKPDPNLLKFPTGLATTPGNSVSFITAKKEKEKKGKRQ